MAYMETRIVDGLSITDMNPPPEQKRDTYVYIIQACGSGNIKIGIAGDVKRRVSGIQTSNHECIEILHCCKYETLSKYDYKDGNYNRLRFLKDELITLIKNINALLPENKKQVSRNTD